MTERCQAQPLTKFDRPLRRMAWVVPVSLCLWIAALAGFSMLLGSIAPRSEVAPLELTLADLPPGTAGGSPGGGAGREGAGTVSGKPMAHSLIPARGHPPTTELGPPAPHVAPPAARVAARKVRHRSMPRSAKKKIVETAPPPSADEGDWSERMQPSPPPIGNTAMAPAPIPPAATTPTQGVVQAPGEGSNALASFGPEGGAGEGKGTGIGAGTGSGGEGGGTGGGSGAGSLPYTTVAHPPVPLTRVLPEYPRLARARGLEGEVVLRAIVDSDGTVERDIEVLQSVPLLNEAAIAALRHWRFEPGRDAGNRPVRVVIQVPLRFRLR